MRDILFRGKRVDNGEWVEGYYLVSAGMPFISVFAVREPIFVVPETVGQYTGLTDKNGNKIFEGDILKIITTIKSDWIKDDNGNYKEPKRTDCATVQEDKNTGGYKLKVYHNGKYKRISKFDIPHINYYYKAEVIGNIHDNPEMLEAIE